MKKSEINAIQLIENTILEGGIISYQDGKWYLFKHSGDSVNSTGADSILQLIQFLTQQA